MKYKKLKKQIEKYLQESDDIYVKRGACIYKIKSVKYADGKILIDTNMDADSLLINVKVKYK